MFLLATLDLVTKAMLVAEVGVGVEAVETDWGTVPTSEDSTVGWVVGELLDTAVAVHQSVEVLQYC